MPKQPNHASGQKDINKLLAAMEADYNGWSRGFAPVMMGSNERPELVLELTNSFMRTNPAIAKHFARVTFFSDTRTELGFLPSPRSSCNRRTTLLRPSPWAITSTSSWPTAAWW